MKAHSIALFVNFMLDAAWWLTAVGLGLIAILLVCSLFVEVGGAHLTMSLPVALQLDSPIHGVHAETDAQLERLRGNLRFPVRKGGFFSGSLAVVMLMFGYLLWLVAQLRAVFRTLSQGLPFVAENARRIRRVGLGVVIGEVGRAVIVYFWSYYASLHFTANGLHFVALADINPIAIGGGLAVLAIAAVFQQAARLKEDQSLTI